VKATFLGHAAWLIEDGGTGVAIDPFLTGNPQAARAAGDIRCQFIFLSHAHGDHMGDAVEIAKRNDALIISSFEVANLVAEQGARSHGMHIGGTFPFEFGRVRLTVAFHGSGVSGGHAAGGLFDFHGKRIYHSGDTSLYSDMKLLHDPWGPVDLALLPIGGNYTMDADDAILAASWIQPKLVVPMHYSTWPLIEADPEAFCARVRAKGIDAKVVRPGESLEF
jgi:L-ascorbate metabolism protein UlaG (beta-lactamase superfamily)